MTGVVVRQALDKHRQRHQLAMLEISRLQTDIQDMQASECNSSEAVVTLRNEVRPSAAEIRGGLVCGYCESAWPHDCGRVGYTLREELVVR